MPIQNFTVNVQNTDKGVPILMKLKTQLAKFSLAAFALLTMVMLFPSEASANNSWGTYHWARTSNPFTLKVGNNLTTASWVGHFRTSNTDWSQSTVLDLLEVRGSANKRCSMVAGTVQVCNSTYGNNGWLGLASINITAGDHITQGSAKMNDTYFNTANYNNPNEKLHVMCQEVGHTLGLGHTSEDGSSQNTCMDYFSNTGANAASTLSLHPNQHDFDDLIAKYAHLDTSTTVSASTSTTSRAVAPSEEVTDNPSSWGRLTSQSANGRSSTYEKEHRNGSKTATHVFWTEEAAEICPGCDHRYHDVH